MKVKRISISVYLLLSIIFIILLFSKIKDSSSIIYALSLAFIPSTLVPLLIEIPNMFNYKSVQIKILFQQVMDIKRNIEQIKYNIDDRISNNSVMLDDQFQTFINNIKNNFNNINSIDNKLFFIKRKNKLLFSYSNILSNLINTLDFSEKKLNLSIAQGRLFKAEKNLKSEVYSLEVIYDLNNIKDTCNNIDEICDKYMKYLFNKDFNDKYQINCMQIANTINSFKIENKNKIIN